MNIHKVIDFYDKIVEDNLDKFLSEIISIASIAEQCENEQDRQKRIMEDMMFVYYNLGKDHKDWNQYGAINSDEITEYQLVTIKGWCENFDNVQKSCDIILEEGY